MFSIAKMNILMVERMKALCYVGKMDRSKPRIMRSICYIVMPHSWAPIDGNGLGNEE